MYSVLIADDNKEFVRLLESKLSTASEYQVVAALNDGLEVITALEHLRPDIVLLDIIMPGADGVNIASHIRWHMPDYNPVIYIISGIGSATIIKALSALDVDFFSMKPVSMDLILQNLQTLVHKWCTDSALSSSSPLHDLAPTTQEYKSKQFITQLGLSSHLRSSKCLLGALNYCLETPNGTELITKGLYPHLAKQYSLTNAAVERRIRHAIEIVQKSKTPLFHRIFSHTGSKRITNGEFLAAITEYYQIFY